ncbi:hypothetical protein PHYPSEUDO_010056 [Phytophthora pseudosyringae]|uniref:Ran guanine nucleotide release factor n=1 Tax=Phytophthora pseudosyringae TaxID=221518 RepID=A0A8T1VBP6_9STRA|nr:hypothetical protein PHYPSEUDO_010056 [Phytophthora pseudosyringae]
MLRPLFGGALSCEVPEGFADVSAFRQVPDNQEVFANAATDQCVIVELLQYEESVADSGSARYFFDEIAQSNGCGPDEVAVLLEGPADAKLAPAGVDAPHATQLIVGDQRVAKFKEGDHAKNVVRVYLGNVRLHGVATDVVLSVSAPMRISPASSSRDAFQFEDSSEEAAAIFKQALQSFAVRDWSLFE